MAWLVDNMQWVLLLFGVVTFSMVQALFMPRTVMRSYLGELEPSPAAQLVARNWGALIAIGGLLLIYAAFVPAVRPAALISVGASKAVFVALMLSRGFGSLPRQAVIAIAIDGLALAVFAAYLVTTGF